MLFNSLNKGLHMLMAPDGFIRGTIGGPLEAHAVEQALEVFAARRSQAVEFDLTNREAGELGMMCGERGLLPLDYMAAGSSGPLELCRGLLNLISEGQRGWLVTAREKGRIWR